VAVHTDSRQQAAELLRQRHEHLEEGADEKAEKIRAGLYGQLEQLEQDETLSDLGRRDRGDQLRQEAREQMTELRTGYERRRRELDLQARQSAFGAAPTSGAGVTAFRDAVDRASRLERADEAQASMQQALDTGDRELARAIAAKAHDHGWVDVVRSWGDAGGGIEFAQLLVDMDGGRKRSSRTGRGLGSLRWSV
jgi:hypothetical protein